MKKIALVLLILTLGGGLFAQNHDSFKNWASASASLLGGGAQYERVIFPEFTVGAEVYWNSFFFFFNNLSIEAYARYYIWNGIYAGLGLGFGNGLVTADYTYTYLYGVPTSGRHSAYANGFLIDPQIGWKIDVGSSGAFFLEPKIQVPIVIGTPPPETWYTYKAGVGAGFRASFAVGYAF
jgi:hypothetical protein